MVATFTESDLGNTAADFTASINWGDGSAASAGTIEPTGAGSYDILGSHTYTATGTFTVNVTLTDNGSTGSTTVAGTTINVTSTGPVNSIPNPIVSTTNVAAAPLTAQGATVTGVEGSALSTGTGVLVATFMDTVAPGPPADYTASIVWGDGSAATAATQITSQGTPNGVVFSVFGNHTYAEQGTYRVTVTITKTASGATAIASGQAVIADARTDGRRGARRSRRIPASRWPASLDRGHLYRRQSHGPDQRLHGHDRLGRRLAGVGRHDHPAGRRRHGV